MPARLPQAPFLLTPHTRTEIRARDDHWRVCIASVGTGLVTGRMRSGSGNAHTDGWSLFRTREQFDACAARDPLRFSDPLMFLQVTKEFDHAFDRHQSAGALPRILIESGPGDGCSGGH
ncbi:MAG: hypothetical protein Q8N44_04035 [Rubrivivax sp.]|nr:hypothetical protein [Rubrivivax sp.]MDP3082849.1 hypothetical protein [Rubrivivax sp.]